MSGLFGFVTPGPMELVIIAMIFLLLFANRLPGVMRSLGRGVVEFKRGISGTDDGDNDKDEGASTGSKP